MNHWKVAAVALMALCLVQLGALVGRQLAADARAEEPGTWTRDAPPLETPAYPGKLRCKLFPTTLDRVEIDLPGGMSEAGQWVQGNSVDWQIYTTDFEIGQKSTGYPQGWLSVCLYPR